MHLPENYEWQTVILTGHYGVIGLGVQEAGTTFEVALESDCLQGAWDIAKGWYRAASRSAPKPSRRDFEELHQERTMLYRVVPSPGAPIPVRLDAPFKVLDEPPPPHSG